MENSGRRAKRKIVGFVKRLMRIAQEVQTSATAVGTTRPTRIADAGSKRNATTYNCNAYTFKVLIN